MTESKIYHILESHNVNIVYVRKLKKGVRDFVKKSDLSGRRNCWILTVGIEEGKHEYSKSEQYSTYG